MKQKRDRLSKAKKTAALWRIKLLTAGGHVKVYVGGRSGTIVEAMREELPTGTDNLVIPAVIVAEHMQSLESTSV